MRTLNKQQFKNLLFYYYLCSYSAERSNRRGKEKRKKTNVRQFFAMATPRPSGFTLFMIRKGSAIPEIDGQMRPGCNISCMNMLMYVTYIIHTRAKCS